MKKATTMISSTIALLMVVLMSHTAIAQTKMHTPNPNENALEGTEELRASLRTLWVEHVGWTRQVILCIVDELPGKDQAVKRLLENQVELGNAIKPYYGNEAGEKLTSLLNPHITIAAEVVTAAKSGDTVVLADATEKWYANADEISLFLSTANPYWELAEVKTMMNEHLKLTIDEVVARVEKDYDADVVAYDKVQDEALKMSDMLTDGIVTQFPEKFMKSVMKVKTSSN
jgi:hypothetical protein